LINGETKFSKQEEKAKYDRNEAAGRPRRNFPKLL
jgi:hypothetical protein